MVKVAEMEKVLDAIVAAMAIRPQMGTMINYERALGAWEVLQPHFEKRLKALSIARGD